jgi:hypothetical protein
MAVRLSTGAVNALAGKGKNQAFIGTDISFTTSTKTIASVAAAFDPEISAGDTLVILGSASNDGTYTVTTVASNGASVTVAESLVDEAASAKIAVVCFSAGGDFREVFMNAVIAVYSGAQPANADAAETGTLLGYITIAGGAFTANSPTNGLVWGEAVSGICGKPSAVEWAIIPIASGIAGWARLYSNAMVTGASSTAIRLDLACGVGAGELRMSTTSLVSGVKSVVNTLNVTVPKSA